MPQSASARSMSTTARQPARRLTQSPTLRRLPSVNAARSLSSGHRGIERPGLAYFRPELAPDEAEAPEDVGLTGTSIGAALSFTKNTTNFAGFVLLAFRPTVWT